MKLNYYPGCSLEGTARDYDQSVKAVCDLLSIELNELEDWNCCGATAAHSLDHRVGINLPARNLAIAEKAGMDVLVPCPLCYNRLKTAEKELIGERKDNYDVSINGDIIKIYDLANFLAQDEILDRLRPKLKIDLKGLRPVCYYGCKASRPPKITGQPDYENPMSMDNILKCLGMKPIQWSYKTDCCGASHLVPRKDIVFDLVGKLYKEAHQAGANCIVVSCQMCQANLDFYQDKIMKQIGADYSLPVLYITELMGIAMDHGEKSNWLKAHIVDPIELIEKECEIRI